jgi:hypothetical protein
LKDVLKKFEKYSSKKQWSKGAHVVPNSVVGPFKGSKTTIGRSITREGKLCHLKKMVGN